MGYPNPIIYCAKGGSRRRTEEKCPSRFLTRAFMNDRRVPLKAHAPFIDQYPDLRDTISARPTPWTLQDWHVRVRYLSPHDAQRPLDPELVNRWTPSNVNGRYRTRISTDCTPFFNEGPARPAS